jgi:hypothetical protein
MLRMIVVGVLLAPLLAGCETTDWFADGSEDYGSTYSADTTTTDDSNNPLSSENVMKHYEDVNRQNCVDYNAGHDVPCYN